MSLSRTIELLPGTAFVLPNVPADLRTLRARLRCETADGRLLGGHSPFLVPQADGVTFVEPLLIEPIAATPQSAVLTAPATTLTAIGQTAQLELTGWLPDGSTVDLTPSASGTIYRSSRPQVAAVSIDGMVEATAGGVALVTAVHEGLVATLSFRVNTAADADADGLPDDFESAYSCLDPGTADAAADPDADGLTNLQELQTGTDPCLADTDGDGLSDAEEGTAGSNPLLPDSDFDGLLDGSEPNPQGDGDGDGRINVLDPDQDDDGLPDGIEVRICGSPTCANPAADNDGDGLSNLDEVELGADPTRADTDGDGLSDSAEILGGTDAIDPDMDGDGFADGFETSQGSDPRDAGSVPNVPPHTEASGSLLSILNLGSPAPPATAEAVSRVLSLLSTAAPPPPTVLEVASRTLSLLSTAVPPPPVLLETDSPLVSVNNSPP
jgi:hypothetical protein